LPSAVAYSTSPWSAMSSLQKRKNHSGWGLA
jgi:hypothetical protein